MPALRTAVIGCGTFGMAHAEAYAELSDVTLAAVCDLDSEKLAKMASRYPGLSTYASYLDLFATERVDLVSVCTMPNTHYPVTLAALEGGVHVLCEKPPALSAAEVAQLIAASTTASRNLVFGFNMRYRPHAKTVRDFVIGGGIGRLVATRAWAYHSYIPWTGRHQIKALSGGGALASSAVHIIDLATWVAGNPVPRAASASMARIFPKKRSSTAPDSQIVGLFDVEDTLSGHVRYGDGSWMSLDCRWGRDYPAAHDDGFEITGEKGAVFWNPLRIFVERDGAPFEITEEIIGSQSAASEPQLEGARSLRIEIADVLDTIRGARPPLADPRQALYVQATIDGLYRSAEQGCEVPIHLPHEGISPRARGGS